jgi:hypothetical protein
MSPSSGKSLFNWTQSIETSSINWAKLSSLLPEDGDRIQSPKRCVLNRSTDNVQKLSNRVNIPSSQTLRRCMVFTKLD